MTRSGVLMVIGACLIALALHGCSKLPKPAAPAEVDEASYCYAAVVGGTETIGCAETPELCETARAAAAPGASEASEQCWPVRLRLDRRAP